MVLLELCFSPRMPRGKTMTDSNLITTIVVSAVTSGATRVVAAPFEGVAEAVKARIKRRLDGTLEKAKAKAGDRDLAYSDQVAAKALNEAAWNDDELTADYLGGVLAGSSLDDDSGAAVIAQIGRLSAIQLRLHYVIYRELRRLDPQPRPNLYQHSEANGAGVRIPMVDLDPVLGAGGLIGLPGTVAALVREGLVGDAWSVGMEPGAPADSPLGFTLQARPTGIGAELFLWGHGVRPVHANRIFEPDLAMTILTDVAATPCSSRMSVGILDAIATSATHDETIQTMKTPDAGASPESITVG
jgi:hypothetical protein